MTKISRDEVEHLAELSSLALSPAEIEARGADIENILEHVATLSELDTANTEPTYQVTDLEFVSRPDVVEESTVTREKLLSLAPDSANNQIKVPKVL